MHLSSEPIDFSVHSSELFVERLPSPGADVVLGVLSKDPSLLDLQRMKPLKHRPGSGVLSVR